MPIPAFGPLRPSEADRDGVGLSTVLGGFVIMGVCCLAPGDAELKGNEVTGGNNPPWTAELGLLLFGGMAGLWPAGILFWIGLPGLWLRDGAEGCLDGSI